MSRDVKATELVPGQRVMLNCTLKFIREVDRDPQSGRVRVKVGDSDAEYLYDTDATVTVYYDSDFKDEPPPTIAAPINGKHDPEEMNGKRAGWGLALVTQVRLLTGTEQEDAVCDAIAYLLHAAAIMGDDPAEQLARAVQHYNQETGSEDMP